MTMSSLYIHIPFCRSKCPYCDFFSVPSEDVPAPYVELLLTHLRRLPREGGALETIFFGGGTPSLLTPSQVAVLLDGAAAHFGLAPRAEVSFEANPGTVSADRLDGYRRAGVNRINFGIQSLHGENLRRLGRIHSAGEARTALENARRAGFVNVGVDLMFALPDQSTSAFLRDLEETLDLAPEHLSLYGLTVEEGTPFQGMQQRGDLRLPDEEVYAESFLGADRLLTERGYRHYEISNYARPGMECRHNLVYWRRRPCLAIGAGAHAFFDRGWGERWAVPQDLSGYGADLAAGRDPAHLVERFDRRGAMAETLYLGLRTAEGVDDEAFVRRFGCGVAEAFADGVSRAGGRLRLEGKRWVLDRESWLLFDTLIAPFL
jgi:oxygen-independent coproporphyrinogen-3 oxidase